ncbi:hypothetical protein PSCLAVI8L_100178 [Pseudoclavibacter sp. 8L]|nr:hypothetical protein PSCLAVI8L_100178 [Pseudoclavibacter sp. 8L]
MAYPGEQRHRYRSATTLSLAYIRLAYWSMRRLLNPA